MGTVGDAAFGRGDVMRELRELRREVRQLQNANRLNAASIGSGGLRIHGGGGVRLHQGGGITVDDGGSVVVGGGDVTIDGGQLLQRVDEHLIPLAALAGGAEARTVAAEETLAGPAGTDTGFTDLDTTGPELTFTTYTGRWLLLLIATVETSGDRAAGRMGYSTDGAQTISANNARSSLVNYAAPGGGVQSAVYAEVRTGTPGEVTVTARYRMIAPPATFPGSAVWSNRAVIVLPY